MLELRDSRTEKIRAPPRLLTIALAAESVVAAAEVVSGSIALIGAELVELKECNK